jgi:hypothetical protein
MSSPTTDPTPPVRPLLPHVPQYQRGPLMNRFLEPVRTQRMTAPATIVQWVIASLQEDLQRRGRWNYASDLQPLRQTLLAMIGHPTEALQLAQEVVAYESMSPEEKEERKAAQAEEGRYKYMATMPPMDKQLGYLKNLGVATAPAHRWEASQLIDARVWKGGGR